MLQHLPCELVQVILELCMLDASTTMNIKLVCKEYRRLSTEIMCARERLYRTRCNIRFYTYSTSSKRVVFTHTRKDETLASMLERCNFNPNLVICASTQIARFLFGKIPKTEHLHDYISHLLQNTQISIRVSRIRKKTPGLVALEEIKKITRSVEGKQFFFQQLNKRLKRREN